MHNFSNPNQSKFGADPVESAYFIGSVGNGRPSNTSHGAHVTSPPHRALSIDLQFITHVANQIVNIHAKWHSTVLSILP